MGKTWDGWESPAAFQRWCLAWARECLRVLKPGAFLLAFGGTRTVHRLTCAIEDAGFEIRDGIDWIYGSGFPKSLDVSKAIDKAAGRAGVAVTTLKVRLAELYGASGKTRARIDAECGFRASNYLTLPAEGKRPDPWVNVLPSQEKWLTIKRVIGATTDTAMEAELDRFFAAAEREVIGYRSVHAGVAFISEGPTVVEITAPATDEARRWSGWGTALKPAREPIVVARKPIAGTVAANVLAYGTGALNIDACRVPGVDAPEGRVRNGGGTNAVYAQDDWTARNQATMGSLMPAGRWPSNVVLSHSPWCEVCECGLRGPHEETPHCYAGDVDCLPGCPVAELDRPSGTPRGVHGERKQQPGGLTEAGTGASRFFPVFRYQAKAPARERPRNADGTAHPTVKPLSLMRWLVRLVCPQGGTVLDPFAGSGTTAEACVVEGFRCVTLERDEAYLPLIMARLDRQAQRPLAAADAA